MDVTNKSLMRAGVLAAALSLPGVLRAQAGVPGAGAPVGDGPVNAVQIDPATVEPPAVLVGVVEVEALDQAAAARRQMTWADVRASVQPGDDAAVRPVVAGPLGRDAEQLVSQARDALEQGGAFRAVRLLRQVEAASPDHVEVVRGLGVAYGMSGNLVRASGYLVRAHKHDPGDLGVLVLLCRYGAEHGGLGRAIGWRDALAGAGYPALADYDLSRTLARLGYRAAAADRLLACVDALDGIDFDALAKERGDSAAQGLGELRVLHGMRASLRMSLGDLNLSLGQLEQAAAQYAQSKPSGTAQRVDIATRLTYLALRRGDASAAVEQVVRGLSGADATQADAALAGYLVSQGVAEEGLRDRVEALVAERGVSLPLLSAVSEVAGPERAYALAEGWLAKNPAEPAVLGVLASMRSFCDERPEDAAALAELLVIFAEQMHRDPARSDAYAAALFDAVGQEVALLRAVARPAFSETQEAHRLVLAARVYEQARRPADAVASYDRAVALDSGLASRVEAARLGQLIKAGEPERVVEKLGGERLPDSKDRLLLLGEAMGAWGDLSGAIGLINRWQGVHGRDIETQLLRVDLIAMARSPHQACSLLLQLINEHPQEERLYVAGIELINKHLMLFRDIGDASELRRMIVDRLLENMPSSVTARVERAYRIYTNPARADEAEGLLLAVLEDEPNHADALSILIRVYELHDKPDKADQMHDRLVRASPAGVNRALSQAGRMIGNGEVERAAEVLKQTLAWEEEGVLPGPALTGDDAASLLQLLNSADPDTDASGLTLRMVLRFPDNVQLNNALGYKWALQGKNLLQAKAMIERAIEKGGDNYAVTDSMAWVHYKLGEFAKAQAYQLRAMQMLRDERRFQGDTMAASVAVLNDHMGDISYKQGDTDAAIRHWQIARAQRLDEQDLMFDPELRTLAKRVDEKLAKAKQAQGPPVSPVPGPEAHGPDGHPADLARQKGPVVPPDPAP